MLIDDIFVMIEFIVGTRDTWFCCDYNSEAYFFIDDTGWSDVILSMIWIL